MPEIKDDERIIFRHSAEYYEGKVPKDKYGKGAGDLLITTHRIFFQSMGGGVIFEAVWSNIEKDQYSPSTDRRVMFLLSMATATASNGENALFLLTSSRNDDDQNLRNALEDIKNIVKDHLSAHKKHDSSSSSSSSSKKPTSRKLTSEEKIHMRRMELLNADKQLKKQYQDLVVDQKMMNDEEFWFSKRNSLDETMLMGNPIKRLGRLLRLHSDVDKNGEINLNAEIIDDIFQMYPAIRAAYNELVPTEYTEKEFWDKYFQSEYFAKDKAGSNFCGKSDDIFEKYANVDRVDLRQKGRLDVDYDIDLVANVEDHQGRVEDTDPVDRGYQESLVVKKYNRHSTLLMNHLEKRDDDNDDDDGDEGERDKVVKKDRGDERHKYKQKNSCDELYEQPEPQYIPLNINRNIATSEDGIGYDEERLRKNEDFQETIGQKRKIDKGDDMKETYSFGTQRYQKAMKIFPSLKRAWKCFQEDRMSIVDGDKSGVQTGDDAMIMDENQYKESLTRTEQPQKSVDTSLYPEKFLAKTREAFTSYSELLRHFYSILGRTGDQAATPGSKSEEKAKKILERLDVIHDHLQRMKQEISTEASSGGQPFNAASVNAQVKCIGGILTLRQQAYDVWKRHMSRFRRS